jgi:hypothetical protein
MLRREVRELRLFEAAKEMTPLVDGSPVYFVFEAVTKGRKELMAAGNPWQTYLNLKSALHDWESIERYLPSAAIEDFEIPRDLHPEDVSKDGAEGADKASAVDLLAEVQEQVRDLSDKDRAELTALSRALSEMSHQADQVGGGISSRLVLLETRLLEANTSVKWILWLVAAIFVVVLFK